MPYGSPPPGWFPPPGQGFPHPPPGQFFPPPGPFGPPGQPLTPQGPPSKSATPGEPATNKEEASSTPQQTVEKPAATVKLPTPTIQAAEAKEGPPPPTESKPDVAAALAPPATNVAKDAPAVAKQTNIAPKSGRIMPAIPMLSPAVKPRASVNGTTQSNATNAPLPAPDNQKLAVPRPTQIPTKSLEDANRDARAAVAAAMAKLPPAKGQGQKKQTNGETSAIDNLTNKVNEMRTDDSIRQSRQPGTGGYAAGHRGGRGGHRGGRQRDDQPVTKMELPKDDYDFASANAKFNKQDLVKEAIAGGSPISSPLNGTSVEDSVNGARRESEASINIPATSGYSKASSFFDNISSEMKDRDDKKMGGREFRNEERNKNLETFGQGSVDNGYRGGFRGRGRGRGFRGQRGGYSGERRGRGGMRGRGAVAAEN